MDSQNKYKFLVMTKIPFKLKKLNYIFIKLMIGRLLN